MSAASATYSPLPEALTEVLVELESAQRDHATASEHTATAHRSWQGAESNESMALARLSRAQEAVDLLVAQLRKISPAGSTWRTHEPGGVQ